MTALERQFIKDLDKLGKKYSKVVIKDRAKQEEAKKDIGVKYGEDYYRTENEIMDSFGWGFMTHNTMKKLVAELNDAKEICVAGNAEADRITYFIGQFKNDCLEQFNGGHSELREEPCKNSK